MPRYTVWTIVFLILLRLAIGWHFFVEGRHKFKTWQDGAAEGNRPFSSEAYFRDANGPIAPYVRAECFLGDPDEQALAHLTPATPSDKAESPAARVPAAVAKEWDDYVNRFIAHFGLKDDDEKEAKNRLNQAKVQLGLWLTTDGTGRDLPDGKLVDLASPKDTALAILANTPVPGMKEEKKTFQSAAYDVKRSTAQRLRDYRDKVHELVALRDQKPWEMGKPVDKAALARVKTDVTTQRLELTDDLNKHTAALEASLGDILKKRADEGLVRPSGNPDEVALSLLEVQPEQAAGGEPVTKGKRLPAPLLKMWDGYAEKLGEVYKLPDATKEKLDKSLDKAKESTVKWLVSPENAARVQAYRDLLKKRDELKRANPAEQKAALLKDLSAMGGLQWNPFQPTPGVLLAPALIDDKQPLALLDKVIDAQRGSLMGDLDKRTDGMKTSLRQVVTTAKADVVPPSDNASGWESWLYEHGYGPDPQKKRLVYWIDFLTVYGLMIMGALLIVGLFTRTACVLAAGFLLLTYLALPPFPWLPPPPPSEGNPLYINKNAIELLALLVLATTASGRWFGLDAWIHALFGRADKPTTSDGKPKEPPSNGSAPAPRPEPVPVAASRLPVRNPGPRR